MAEVNVTINLPVLPDNAPWWLNFAAWQSYWDDANLTINVGEASPTEYGVVQQATTEPFVAGATTNNDAITMVVDGVQYQVPSLQSFQQLKTAFETLQTNYQNAKTALQSAGIITAA